MEVVHDRCCGLDVHKRFVAACLITPGPDGAVQKSHRTFGTMTEDLLALADWLGAAGCTHVAMESTGVYWKPVYNVLEDQCTVLVVNAQHLKQVPGRKTDVRDAEWIADLLRHGLVRGSFVPPRGQRELRDLTRTRTTLVREGARIANRIQKVLEDANIKLGDVASDVLGASGRAMLQAMVAGERDPVRLAGLAQGRLREKHDALVAALRGRLTAHHAFLLRVQLDHLAAVEATCQAVTDRIRDAMRPFTEAIELWDTIPGINRDLAEVLVAEVGVDLTRFGTAARLASWAGMCPGHDESAGKRRRGTTRKGSPWLRSALIQAARGAQHKKHSYLKALYHRLAARRGAQRAAVAVGHAILVIAFHVLTRGEPYRDLGGNYFDERDATAVQRRLVRRLERLGFAVTLAPAA
jgi:transposase